jgi:hypothetical protein
MYRWGLDPPIRSPRENDAAPDSNDEDNDVGQTSVESVRDMCEHNAVQKVVAIRDPTEKP